MGTLVGPEMPRYRDASFHLRFDFKIAGTRSLRGSSGNHLLPSLLRRPEGSRQYRQQRQYAASVSDFLLANVFTEKSLGV